MFEDTFYWADDMEFHPRIQNRQDVNWVAAKGLKWRNRNDWMVEQLRYGTNEI